MGDNASNEAIADYYEHFDLYSMDVCNVELDEENKNYLIEIYKRLSLLHLTEQNAEQAYKAIAIEETLSGMESEFAGEVEEQDIDEVAVEYMEMAKESGMELSEYLSGGVDDSEDAIALVSQYLNMAVENEDKDLAEQTLNSCEMFAEKFPEKEESFALFKALLSDELGDTDTALVILDGILSKHFDMDVFGIFSEMVIKKGDVNKYFNMMESIYRQFEKAGDEASFEFYDNVIDHAREYNLKEVYELWMERKMSIYSSLIRSLFYFATVMIDTGRKEEAYKFIAGYQDVLDVLGVEDVDDLSVKQFYELADREAYYTAKKKGEPFVETTTDPQMQMINEMMQEAINKIWIFPDGNQNDEALRQKKVLKKLADANVGDACYLYGRTCFGSSCVPGCYDLGEDYDAGEQAMLKGVELDTPLAIVGGFRMCEVGDVANRIRTSSYETKLDMFDALYCKALSGDLMSAFVIAHAFYWQDIFFFFDFDMTEEIEHYSALAAAYFYEMLWQAGSDLGSGNYKNIFSSGEHGIPVNQEMINHINRK